MLLPDDSDAHCPQAKLENTHCRLVHACDQALTLNGRYHLASTLGNSAPRLHVSLAE